VSAIIIQEFFKNLPPKKNLKLSSARRSRDFGISRGAYLAACGGENRPNYFKNRPHFRKAQGIGSRLASLGGQFVLNFGRKNQLAILLLGKENF